MILAALLMAILPQASTASDFLLSTATPPRDPFTPENVLSVPDGPRVVKLPAPGSEVVAIRVSIPLAEGHTEAGAGRLLQILSAQRVEGLAGVLGLHVEGARTPWGISYTVAGVLTDFEDLVAVLREAVAEPDVANTEFERHRRALHDEMLRTIELPAARLGAELRARAVTEPPPDGTPATLDRMTRVTLRDVWARTHQPSRMSIVVSGDVPDETLLTAFEEMGAPGGRSSGRPEGAAQPPQRGGTQVYRHWYGEAFRVADPRDPHAAVVTVLASDWLRVADEPFEAAVQLWETGDVQLITVVAAAYTGNSVAMRQRMPRLLVNTRQALTAAGVESAVSRLRREVLVGARTPVGLVNVVGRHMDATGEPGGARRFLNALDRVSLESTRAFLSTLERQAPLRAEVRP
jgi:predicted Zn-dependent peptidase